MTTLRDGDLLATLQQIDGYVPPPSVARPVGDRCYTKSKMPDIYRKVMYGKGPMTTLQIAAALGRLRKRPSNTKCAVNSCIRYQLAPMGLVKTLPAKPGRGNEVTHEWIGE